MNSWVVIPLTVAALGICWLLAWLALLLVFMWLVRRRSDAATLRVFVKLAQTWRMPTAPMHVLAAAAARRQADEEADDEADEEADEEALGRGRRRRGRRGRIGSRRGRAPRGGR